MKSGDVPPRRIRNSGLGDEQRRRPEDVVRRHLAMQAQDIGPTRWAIGQRAGGQGDGDVVEALSAGAIVRTHVLRPTWHFVAREDARWLLALTGPRVQKKNGPRYRELGLDAATLGRCEKVIADELGDNHLTRDQIGVVLKSADIDPSGQRLPYILMHCELQAVVCSGRPSGNRQTYALFDERVSERDHFDRDRALGELTRRYLASHGPATVHDLRWWSSLTVADLKTGFEMLGSEVTSETVDDLTFWMLTKDRPAATPRGAHLLHVYDELIVGYSDSRYFGDALAKSALAAWRGRTVPTGVVVLHGNVFGHWRQTVARDSVIIEVQPYAEVNATDGRALETAAEHLARFLGVSPSLEVTRIRERSRR